MELGVGTTLLKCFLTISQMSAPLSICELMAVRLSGLDPTVNTVADKMSASMLYQSAPKRNIVINSLHSQVRIDSALLKQLIHQKSSPSLRRLMPVKSRSSLAPISGEMLT